MATRKTPKKKTKAARKKRSASPAAISRAESQKFERQNDLSTLQRADEIRRDPKRMAGAKREASDQAKALTRIQKGS
jgi:hypothetical protein